MKGFVSFVGSGPGDPELLTLKAVDRLRRADAVLFDDLSAGPILNHARSGADLIGVGKRAGRPSPKQHHVSRLLVDYAQKGGRIVRLKSGDSGTFGRLEEETSALREAAIDFEIIPGVPSACAAAAAAGIPLTRRLTARRVQFITGHDVRGALPEDMNMAALADPLATTVVFMGQRTFPAFAHLLINHGLPPETPALLAEGISTPAQALHRMSVVQLAARLAESISDAPALILYGPLAETDDNTQRLSGPGTDVNVDGDHALWSEN
ncbi:MAG: uroporphyrinogen-III C-methyltransferase [Paracoccaceae bacterium]